MEGESLLSGSDDILFCSVAMSMDGINKDHTDAATITPAANPYRTFSTLLFSLSFIKKTIAAPNTVPANGINKHASIFISLTSL